MKSDEAWSDAVIKFDEFRPTVKSRRCRVMSENTTDTTTCDPDHINILTKDLRNYPPLL